MISKEELEISVYKRKWQIENGKNDREFMDHLKTILQLEKYGVPSHLVYQIRFHDLSQRKYALTFIDVGFSYRETSRYLKINTGTLYRMKNDPVDFHAPRADSLIPERLRDAVLEGWNKFKTKMKKEGFRHVI